jgi:hypothetical protein
MAFAFSNWLSWIIMLLAAAPTCLFDCLIESPRKLALHVSSEPSRLPVVQAVVLPVCCLEAGKTMSCVALAFPPLPVTLSHRLPLCIWQPVKLRLTPWPEDGTPSSDMKRCHVHCLFALLLVALGHSLVEDSSQKSTLASGGSCSFLSVLVSLRQQRAQAFFWSKKRTGREKRRQREEEGGPRWGWPRRPPWQLTSLLSFDHLLSASGGSNETKALRILASRGAWLLHANPKCGLLSHWLLLVRCDFYV